MWIVYTYTYLYTFYFPSLTKQVRFFRETYVYFSFFIRAKSSTCQRKTRFFSTFQRKNTPNDVAMFFLSLSQVAIFHPKLIIATKYQRMVNYRWIIVPRTYTFRMKKKYPENEKINSIPSHKFAIFVHTFHVRLVSLLSSCHFTNVQPSKVATPHRRLSTPYILIQIVQMLYHLPTTYLLWKRLSYYAEIPLVFFLFANSTTTSETSSPNTINVPTYSNL